ncbi:MAG TPA: AzlD domain-containing protein [Erysipelotrichaceae bacterium]|nr:AzlD domain-containing protein [Erysipelotrichaceae bacterium]
MTIIQVSIYVGLMMFASVLTRFLPFIFFPENKPLPNWIQFVSDRLPYASLGMILVYALKDTSLDVRIAYPEIISLIWITIIHLKYKQTLLSISTSVLLYLFLVN